MTNNKTRNRDLPPEVPEVNSVVEVFKLQVVDDPFGLTPKADEFGNTPKHSRRNEVGCLVVNTRINEAGEHEWQCDFCGKWTKTIFGGRNEVFFIVAPNVLNAKCFDCEGVDKSKFFKIGGN